MARQMATTACRRTARAAARRRGRSASRCWSTAGSRRTRGCGPAATGCSSSTPRCSPATTSRSPTAGRSSRSAPGRACSPTRSRARTSCSARPSAPTSSSTSAAGGKNVLLLESSRARRLDRRDRLAARRRSCSSGCAAAAHPSQGPRPPGPHPALEVPASRQGLDVRAQQGPPRLVLVDQRQAVRPEAGRPPGRAGSTERWRLRQHQRQFTHYVHLHEELWRTLSATASARRPWERATRTPGGWTPARASWSPRGSPTTPGSS